MKNLIKHLGVLLIGFLFVIGLTANSSGLDVNDKQEKLRTNIPRETASNSLFDFLKEDEFCWKETYGRGVGIVPTICPNGMKNDAGLCYPLCNSGYNGAGPVCWGDCPPEFRDDGAFCAKPAAYNRPQYPWIIGDPAGSDKKMWERCEAANGKGNCVKEGLIVYANCKEGFNKAGCCVCSPVCPAGWTDIGVSCTKPSYGRGVGIVPTICPDGKQYNAGLCYKLCKPGYVGVGPVCWEVKCPLVNGAQWTDCGAGCAKSTNSCATSIVDMVNSPLVAVLSIAGLIITGGGSGAASAGAGAAITATTKAGKIVKYTTKVVKGAAAISKLAIKNDLIAKAEEALNGKPMPANQRKGLEEYASMAYEAARSYNFDWRDFTAIDPTGLATVAAAYANPLCKDVIPPTLVTKSGTINTSPTTTNTTSTSTTTNKTIDGRNVIEVSYSSGLFVNVGGKVWQEKPSNSINLFNFEEVGRDDWSVYLHDKARSVYIMMNLWKKEILWKRSASANYTKLYSITGSK